MNYSELITRAGSMQLATEAHGQPWICTVSHILYEGKLYWLSEPGRRHSQEIEANAQAAVAIVLKADWPIIGFQAEGEVTVVSDVEIARPIIAAYVARHKRGQQFIELLAAGKNQHQLYSFTPRQAFVFDELNVGKGIRTPIDLT